MEQKLVSIIIPVYNGEKYIIECVESVLSQSYKNLEIIIINDGSTDNTKNILQKNYGQNKQIKLINRNNSGVANARNYGLDISEGDYITFVDGDDWIAPNFIESAVNVLEKHDADFVHGGTIFVYPNKKESHIPDGREKERVLDEQIGKLKKVVLSNVGDSSIGMTDCFTSGSVCKLYKKELIGTEIRFNNDLKIGEDTVFNMEILSRSSKAVVISEKWYFYRINEVSATKKINTEIQESTQKLMRALNIFVEGDKSLCIAYYERAIQQFYGILILYPMHPMCDLNKKEKIDYIKKLLCNEFWRELFRKINICDLESSIADRILVFLSKKKSARGVFHYVKIRRILKNIII